MGLDMSGYVSDPKSLYHLNIVADIHWSLARAYEGDLENLLGPLINLVRKELE